MFNNSTIPKYNIYNRYKINQPTQYIFNQEKSDKQLGILLSSLVQFNTFYELGELLKAKELVNGLLEQLGKIDQRHRSYLKVKCQVICACCLVFLENQDIQLLEEFMQEEEKTIQHIGLPQYTAKMRLMKVLYLMYKLKVMKQKDREIKNKQSNTLLKQKVLEGLSLKSSQGGKQGTVQAEQVSQISKNNKKKQKGEQSQSDQFQKQHNLKTSEINKIKYKHQIKQIQQAFRKFSKIKLRPRYKQKNTDKLTWTNSQTNLKSVQNQNQHHQTYFFYNPLLWEELKVLEILVYQYILLVQKLAEYDEVRATYIYRRGSYIVKRLLGRDHRFSVMMREITKLKKHTNKLIREDKERDKQLEFQEEMAALQEELELEENQEYYEGMLEGDHKVMHASPSKSKLASASVAMSGLLPISSIAPASAETGKVKFKLKRSKSKKSKKLLKKDQHQQYNSQVPATVPIAVPVHLYLHQYPQFPYQQTHPNLNMNMNINNNNQFRQKQMQIRKSKSLVTTARGSAINRVSTEKNNQNNYSRKYFEPNDKHKQQNNKHLTILSNPNNNNLIHGKDKNQWLTQNYLGSKITQKSNQQTQMREKQRNRQKSSKSKSNGRFKLRKKQGQDQYRDHYQVQNQHQQQQREYIYENVYQYQLENQNQQKEEKYYNNMPYTQRPQTRTTVFTKSATKSRNSAHNPSGRPLTGSTNRERPLTGSTNRDRNFNNFEFDNQQPFNKNLMAIKRLSNHSSNSNYNSNKNQLKNNNFGTNSHVNYTNSNMNININPSRMKNGIIVNQEQRIKQAEERMKRLLKFKLGEEQNKGKNGNIQSGLTNSNGSGGSGSAGNRGKSYGANTSSGSGAVNGYGNTNNLKSQAMIGLQSKLSPKDINRENGAKIRNANNPTEARSPNNTGPGIFEYPGINTNTNTNNGISAIANNNNPNTEQSSLKILKTQRKQENKDVTNNQINNSNIYNDNDESMAKSKNKSKVYKIYKVSDLDQDPGNADWSCSIM